MVMGEEFTLLAFPREGVGIEPGRTALYCELGELEKRVRAVDHLTSLARLSRVDDENDGESEKAFANEEPCLARARDLVGVSHDLASLETAVIAWGGVQAASRAATNTKANVLVEAAETAFRLERALRDVHRGETYGRNRPRKNAVFGIGDVVNTYTSSTTALNALNAAANALRAAAADTSTTNHSEEVGKNVGKKRLEKENVDDARVAHNQSTLTQIAPWLSETSGRWSRAHAAMVTEFRGSNPTGRKTNGEGTDGENNASRDDGAFGESTNFRHRPSPWVTHALRATRVLCGSANGLFEAAVEDTPAVEQTAEPINDSRNYSRNYSRNQILSILGDYFERTVRSCANWICHQPHLSPKTRTAFDLCVLVADCEVLYDGMVELEEVFERVGRVKVRNMGQTDDQTDTSEHVSSKIRRAVLVFQKSRKKLIDGVGDVLGKQVTALYDTSPPGTWSSKKLIGLDWKKDKGVDEKENGWSAGASASAKVSKRKDIEEMNLTRYATPHTFEVRDQILAPLFSTFHGIDTQSALALTCVTGIAAMDSLLTRVLSEGPGGVRLATGGAHRLSADVTVLANVIENTITEKLTAGSVDEAEQNTLWHRTLKKANAAVQIAEKMHDPKLASREKNIVWGKAKITLGTIDAETWKKTCVK